MGARDIGLPRPGVCEPEIVERPLIAVLRRKGGPLFGGPALADL